MSKIKKTFVSKKITDKISDSDRKLSTSVIDNNLVSAYSQSVDVNLNGTVNLRNKECDRFENTLSKDNGIIISSNRSKLELFSHRLGVRPRLNLTRRTIQVPSEAFCKLNAALTTNVITDDYNNQKNSFLSVCDISKSTINVKSTQISAKSNPFGSATAVDTASRLNDLELKTSKKGFDIMIKNYEHSRAPTRSSGNIIFPGSRNLQTVSKCLHSTSEKVTSDPITKNLQESSSRNTVFGSADRDIVNNINIQPRLIECKIKKKERRSRRRREPKIVNSRAALLGETSTFLEDKEVKWRNKSLLYHNKLPLTIVNQRIANLAKDEKNLQTLYPTDSYKKDPNHNSQNRECSVNHTSKVLPTPAVSSFCSKFSRERRLKNYSEDSSKKNHALSQCNITNTRFTAAIEAEKNIEDIVSRNLGPPPIYQNSRFTLAARAIENLQGKEKTDDNKYMSRKEPNSIHDRMGTRLLEGKRTLAEKNGRSFYDSRCNNDHRSSITNRYSRISRDKPGREVLNQHNYLSRTTKLDYDKTLLVAPTLPDHLQPKKKSLPKLPPVEAPLALPGEDENVARARMERRKKDEAEKQQIKETAIKIEHERRMLEEMNTRQEIIKAAELENDLLNMFVSRKIWGKELAKWCVNQGSLLLRVDKLILSVLETEPAGIPDSECKWARPSKFGEAILSIVDGNTLLQMQVLCAIQKYCCMKDFPRIDDEYLVHAMFRSIYKLNIVNSEAFYKWKEDESEEYREGKTKTIIQTVNWFNWLEEVDELSEQHNDDENLIDNINYFDDEQDIYL